MSWTCAIVNASSALFRKSVAMSIDNQYTEYHGAGDRLFWIEIAENGNVGIDYHPLNFFRIHDNNSTKRHYDEGINQKEDFKILNYIKEKNYITTKQYHKIKRDYARWNIYSTRLSPLYRKEVSNLWNLRFSDIVFIHYTILRDILKECDVLSENVLRRICARAIQKLNKFEGNYEEQHFHVTKHLPDACCLRRPEQKRERHGV